MSTYQKVIILGRVGRDPALRYTSAGSAVVTLSLATSRRWKSKQTGEQQEEIEWHRVVAYDKLAEIIGEYAKKGGLVLIDGRLKTRKWEKDGVDMYTTEIVAESMQLTGSRQEVGEGKPALPNQARPEQTSRPKSSTAFDHMDDDIPF